MQCKTRDKVFEYLTNLLKSYIIQDSHENWTREGGQMDQIYASSYMTISADTSSGTNTGFLHQRDVVGWQTCVHPDILVPWDRPTPGQHYGTYPGHTLGRSKLIGSPVPRGASGICCGIVPAKVFMDTSILADRGWIPKSEYCPGEYSIGVYTRCHGNAMRSLHRSVSLPATEASSHIGSGLHVTRTKSPGKDFANSSIRTPIGAGLTD